MSERRPTSHPLIELTTIRLKEFLREPDAVFWVFAFPLLLTVALGFAFREKPPDRIPIGIVGGSPAAQARIASLQKSPALLVRVYSQAEGREQLRRGKISLLVEGDAMPVYRLDPTRPDARTARVEVDDALQT
jgi:ABC-2 type transport system permease protein